MLGKTRLFIGFCPECNSDAPKYHDCVVCEGYDSGRSAPFPPTQETKDKWWRRFTMARCQHGRPMEDTDCPQCVAMLRGFAEAHRNAQDPRRG